MAITKTGRAGAILKIIKDGDVKDIMDVYFDHPVWSMKRGYPVPDMPLDVQLELENRCNLSCESCNANKQKRQVWHSEQMNEFRRKVRSGVFQREICKSCGGEIRTLHREKENTVEEKLTFI